MILHSEFHQVGCTDQKGWMGTFSLATGRSLVVGSYVFSLLYEGQETIRINKSHLNESTDDRGAPIVNKKIISLSVVRHFQLSSRS